MCVERDRGEGVCGKTEVRLCMEGDRGEVVCGGRQR